MRTVKNMFWKHIASVTVDDDIDERQDIKRGVIQALCIVT